MKSARRKRKRNERHKEMNATLFIDRIKSENGITSNDISEVNIV